MPQHDVLLTCPHCFTTLKLGDDTLVGKCATCPSCNDPILLGADAVHGIVGLVPPAGAPEEPLVLEALKRAREETPAEAVPETPSPRVAATAVAGPAKNGSQKNHAPATAAAGIPGKPSNDSRKNRPARKRGAAGVAATASHPVTPATRTTSFGKSLLIQLQSPISIAGLAVGAVSIVMLIVAAPRKPDQTSNSRITAPAGDVSNTPPLTDSVSPTVAAKSAVANRAEIADEPADVAAAKPKKSISDDPTPPIDPPEKTPLAAADGNPPPREIVPAPLRPSETFTADAEIPEVLPAAAPEPRAVPAAPPREPIDVASRLKLPISQFEQIKAAPLKQLLQLIEEMVGVPIKLDEKAPKDEVALLDRAITVKLQNTTVGGILQSVADQGGLAWEVRDEVIWLRKKD